MQVLGEVVLYCTHSVNEVTLSYPGPLMWKTDILLFPEGYYIYLQGSKQEPADVARLVSPVCSSEGPHCFRFWYHMYGAAETMALRVYVVQNETETLEWRDAGNKTDSWNLGEVTVYSTGNMQVRTETLTKMNSTF